MERNHTASGLSNSDFSQLPSCGDFDIRIARDGTWFYRGSPIGRATLVRLFSTVLRRENGEYWLVTPAERGLVTVDDAAFVAVAVEAEGEGRDRQLVFRTNVDDFVRAGPDHPIRVAVDADGRPRPYLHVRGAIGEGLEALILRPVFYHLVELGEMLAGDGGDQVGVWSGGTFFPLGPVS